MAKTKIPYKRLQREMLERMSKQRRNRNNWTKNCESKTKKEI